MKKYLLVFVGILLIYTRFVGLDWGLPYPMHPDERNMVDAILRLECPIETLNTFEDLRRCHNPGFFAYGQLPLYIALIIAKIWGGIYSMFSMKYILNFASATLSLRVVSAIASIFLSISMWQLYRFLQGKIPELSISNIHLARWIDACVLLLLVFQPYLIQYAHFGTTETLLMLLYVLIVYSSLRYIERPTWKWVAASGLAVGVAFATKTSALIFVAVPFVTILYSLIKRSYISSLRTKVYAAIRYLFVFMIVSSIMYVLSSPHNILSLKDFINAMRYEIPVGNGSLAVFYTRQFVDTIPYLFQFTHIFPFALGLPVLLLFIFGFFVLPWKNPYIHIMRVAWLVYFVVTGSLFVKWSRFMAPIMPLMTLFAIHGFIQLFVHVDFNKRFVRLCFLLLAGAILVPGVAYVPIYSNPDVRFVASTVIANTISSNSKILEEGGNVINIPVPPPDSTFILPYYLFTTIDAFDIPKDSDMANIQDLLDQADVVIIPSRRAFSSRTCLRPSDVGFDVADFLLMKNCEKISQTYPNQQIYYKQVFDESTFIQTAKVSSYPRLEIFGKILIEFPDEFAEETWTVFDHPVVRIYKRVNSIN